MKTLFCVAVVAVVVSVIGAIVEPVDKVTPPGIEQLDPDAPEVDKVFREMVMLFNESPQDPFRFRLGSPFLKLAYGATYDNIFAFTIKAQKQLIWGCPQPCQYDDIILTLGYKDNHAENKYEIMYNCYNVFCNLTRSDDNFA